MTTTLLDIKTDPVTKKNINETIESFLNKTDSKNCFQIISLNPEIIVETLHSSEYKQVVNEAQIRLVDGVGVTVAGMILGTAVGERYPGVELMEELMSVASERKLRVLVVGGVGGVAEQFIKQQQPRYPGAVFKSSQAFKNIKKQTPEEEKNFIQLLSAFQPKLLFVAFGAPFQDILIYKHKDKLTEAVAMGVGGGVDFLAGGVRRAPPLLQALGLEWLFRLFVQPWRWKRQLRLIEFIYLVFKEKLKKIFTE